ncbi:MULTISPECIES: hypothetical protein [Nocardioides]|uniref:hypothetical protein n=1 Tax=Nocardioides TaxID=1839 RepID=UPI00033140BA|nr:MULTISPECIES: hypothetical protein [Nocardioides]EON25435.1 hypothetical protein CF8_0465 [Nocardioides sp. CF8]
MRMIRTVIVGLLTALLGLSAVVVAPAQADQALPKRTIVEQPPGEHQLNFDTFLLKGKVLEPQADGTELPYAERKVHLQKKACAKGCNWRTVKKVKTNDDGKFRTKIYAPQDGRWKWRVKVKASDGYGTTKGEVWTLFFN